MRCPLCAEEIQDAAVLCRFCGGRRAGDDTWVPPEPSKARPPRPKGEFTMKSTAVLLALSAAYEFSTISDKVPLFGAMRGGAAAVIHHLLFTAVFGAMAVGLWRARKWGYAVTMAGVILYAAWQFLGMVDTKAMAAEFEEARRSVEAYGLGADMLERTEPMLIKLTIATRGIVAICVLGFGLYVHWRREYFSTSRPS